MTKTVLFVTYGGGHARMVVPVVQALQRDPHIRIETLALTAAAAIFRSEGLPYKGYRDFIAPQDAEALAWGKQLAREQHNPDSGIEEAESVAYLGLCYQDLAVRHGMQEAARLWRERGRQAFLPLSVMERVMRRIKPDIVVTTNSPRSERAATLAANALGIPTLCMVDLFGLDGQFELEARFITVLSEGVIDNIRRKQKPASGQQFLVTGNPAFDEAFDYRGPINHEWRRRFLPMLPEDAKVLLWIDDYGFVRPQSGRIHVRNEGEITEDLNLLAAAARQAGAWLLIRPHPSQQAAIHQQWVAAGGFSRAIYAGDFPLYPLLNASDILAMYESTVGCQALLMPRPLIQLDYEKSRLSLPLAEWGMAWKACRADLPAVVQMALHDKKAWQQMQKRIESLLPQEKAAIKVASHIKHILGMA